MKFETFVKSLKSNQHPTIGRISPFALLVLAACGGGGGGGGGSAPTSFDRFGNVIKGPLENANAFLDYDGDGVQDAGEPSVKTNSEGYYSITGAVGFENANVVVTTDESTVDQYGSIVSGLTLTAPAAAKVGSMASTLIVATQKADPTLSVEQATAKIQAAMGLTDVASASDFLSFNPFAAGVDAATLSKVENASQQVALVLDSLATAAEGAGLSTDAAFAASLAAVTTVVTSKTGTQTINLTSTAATGDLQAITNLVKATVATEAAKAGSTVNASAFNNTSTLLIDGGNTN